MIAKARSYIGKESDLDSFRSVKFVGTITDDQGGSGTVEIIFQKPLHHRISIKVKETQDVKALDDYEAWNHTKNGDGQWRFRILDSGEVSRLRAIVWENLNFYKGIERIGGRAVAAGKATIDGVECLKVDFRHPQDTTFERYFDRKTGRLVMTKTDDATEIREEGELRGAGIRFPQKVITTSTQEQRGEDGVVKKVKRTTTIAFESIKVNDAFPADTFSTPLFTGMP